MERMGERIKKKRVNIGLQVKDLSNKIGVTSSLISQIEKAKAFPSIITLKRIAEALHTTVRELIGENETLIQNPLLKVNDRKFFKQNEKGTSLFLLSHHDPFKQIEPFVINFEKKTDSSEIMTSNYPGQEFCFVLKGSFDVILNKEKFIINEGDSFYFNSNHSHLFTNTSNKSAQLLWVVTHYNI